MYEGFVETPAGSEEHVTLSADNYWDAREEFLHYIDNTFLTWAEYSLHQTGRETWEMKYQLGDKVWKTKVLNYKTGAEILAKVAADRALSELFYDRVIMQVEEI